MSPRARPVSTWRKVAAAVLDFLTVFFGFGYLVAYFTGGLTAEGFQLNGGPAFVLFALIVAYFVVGNRIMGGTLWQRILGAR